MLIIFFHPTHPLVTQPAIVEIGRVIPIVYKSSVPSEAVDWFMKHVLRTVASHPSLAKNHDFVRASLLSQYADESKCSVERIHALLRDQSRAIQANQVRSFICFINFAHQRNR